MFHVKHIWSKFISFKLHEVLFYLFLITMPLQTRIILNPSEAYISWYFNYHLAIIFYLSDLMLVSCFISWFVIEKPKFKVDRIIWLILAFFVLTFTTWFHVKHLNLSILGVFKWIELLLLILYVRETFRETIQFYSAGTILFVSALIQSILALWQFHVQHMVGFTWLGEYIAPLGVSGLATIDTVAGKVIRAYGTFPHPNVLAGFLIFGLLMGFYIVSRETKYRSLVAGGTILITLGIFVTFSRLAWLGAGIAYVCFVIYWLWQKQWQKGLILAIIGLVSCGTIWFGYNNYLKTRVLDTNPTSITDRGFFNNLGSQIITQHPLFGIGAGNYVPALQKQSTLQPWQYQPPHNIFIFLAAELGIGALAIFILLIAQILQMASTAPRSAIKFALILLGLIFIALGQFDHYFVTIQQGRLMLFVLLGLLAALPNLNYEKSN